MNDNLLRYDDNQKYLIFDFETCNLNLVNPDNRPWQLSFITRTKNKILKKHDHFLKWKNLKVSDGAQKATRFDHTKYRIKSEDPLPILRKFDKLLYDKQYKIVGHNLLGFDVYMVDVWRRQMARDLNQEYVSRIIDTKALATAIAKDIKYTDGDFINWQYKLLHYRERGLKTSQGFLLKHYGIDHDPKRLHDGLYDIEMNFKIFKRQLFDLEL